MEIVFLNSLAYSVLDPLLVWSYLSPKAWVSKTLPIFLPAKFIRDCFLFFEIGFSLVESGDASLLLGSDGFFSWRKTRRIQSGLLLIL